MVSNYPRGVIRQGVKITKFGRKLNSKVIQLNIILEQQCRCAYCNRPLLGLSIEWDHIIPYSYKKLSVDNWAASCKECNNKKNAKFLTEESMVNFIIERMNWSKDNGEGIPEGHDEYWKRVLYTDPSSSITKSQQSQYDKMKSTR